MAIISINNPLAFAFGLMGNIISLVVYFAPVPTFYQVCRKKSIEGFHSVPYVVALFSSMLWLYYALAKPTVFLITINGIGCITETIYITLYITYGSKEARTTTMKLFLLLNLGLFSLILVITHFLVRESVRAQVLGWVCAVVSVAVFAAPLSVMAKVIREKSSEYMPIMLSIFLTLSAVAWFSYGLVLEDLFVAIPNVFGLILGLVQMVLYGLYRNGGGEVGKEVEEKVQDHVISVVTSSQAGSCGNGVREFH